MNASQKYAQMPQKLHFSVSMLISPVMPFLSGAISSFFGNVYSTVIASELHTCSQRLHGRQDSFGCAFGSMCG